MLARLLAALRTLLLLTVGGLIVPELLLVMLIAHAFHQPFKQFG